jgi:hypothetical protein
VSRDIHLTLAEEVVQQYLEVTHHGERTLKGGLNSFARGAFNVSSREDERLSSLHVYLDYVKRIYRELATVPEKRTA